MARPNARDKDYSAAFELIHFTTSDLTARCPRRVRLGRHRGPDCCPLCPRYCCKSRKLHRSAFMIKPGNGEFDRFFASARKADRDCNIEPPASPYAIMFTPTAERTVGPARTIIGELDTRTRN